MNYRVRVVQEFIGGREMWTAQHPELLGCHTVGPTCAIATAALGEAREGWLRQARKHAATIPGPASDDLWVQVVFADITGMER